jgi:Fe-S-cluster containining protein
MNPRDPIHDLLAGFAHNTYSPFLDRLKIIYAAMDRKYQAAADYYGFHCTGCEDNCCFTRFYHYTLLEYLYILEGLNNLDGEKRAQIKRRALEVCRETDRADAEGVPMRLMCPLCVDSICLLYAYRPMICRLHGIPHELHRPGEGLLQASGCDAFTRQFRGKQHFKFDRTPFYLEMAGLEKELRQALGMPIKIKMTVAQMIKTYSEQPLDALG